MNMEDVLVSIAKEATGSKLSHLRQAAQEANGEINSTYFVTYMTNRKTHI